MKRPRKPLPTQKYLQEIFDYDFASGDLYHKKSRGSVASGAVAGSLADNGLMVVRINKVAYYVHKIIWRWVTGEDLGAVDLAHKDGNLMNNTWSNLKPKR